MNDINIITENINEAGTDINTLVSEIKELFDDTFLTIENMVNKNDDWLGISAEKYLTETIIDKQNYINLRKNLNDFGQFLINYSLEMESKISQVKR